MPIEKKIEIKGARSNNLKNIDVTIPRNELVVVTGVSGSGKSTLTMDTLYAEGQRRYVESLSSYARQFLGRMKKPEVDYIKGICPAIAIEQRVSGSNSRSTVGSMTETYEYLRLLYARVGRTYSPHTGEEVRKHEVTDVVKHLQTLPAETGVYLLIPLTVHDGRSIEEELNLLLQKGFIRLWSDSKTLRVEDALLDTANINIALTYILIDRFVLPEAEAAESTWQRAADSVQTCFNESGGSCWVYYNIDNQSSVYKNFNNKYEIDGVEFPEPTQYLFNYNNPYGACPQCEGYGKTLGIDRDKVIPDKSKSMYEGAVACWRGEQLGEWHKTFMKSAHQFDFPVHRAWRDLSPEEQALIWTGNKWFRGIDEFFKEVESQTYKIQYRVMLARYRGKTICPSCNGARLRKEASYVKVGGRAITDLYFMPITELLPHFAGMQLNEFDAVIAKRLLQEVTTRLEFMVKVGLGYLHLDRVSSSLSGGETQRIYLTRTLGSNLTSSLYILDEPSIGLHPRDTNRLIDVLKNLRDMGNTVVVVEHEEDMIRNADYLIDIGPAAGVHGGEVVFQGKFSDIYKRAGDSLTAKYMNGTMQIAVPQHRRQWIDKIELKDVREHNLKGFDVEIPLGVMSVITGVSGSGKTTLIKQILYPALAKHVGEATTELSGSFAEMRGDLTRFNRVEMINQNPIGKSSRSNPVTYVKAYDDIRDLFANQQLSKIKGFKPKHFSFNVEGGRCETCKGEGEQIVEMQFLADVRLQCEMCKGKRFQADVLEVRFREKNIFEVLSMSIEDSLAFFAQEKTIIDKIKPLNDVGLGYVQMGQSSSTLSGGEAQRVKLASFLSKDKATEHIVFIFDEPTTGLHFHDIGRLLDALNALVEKGHTVLVIEHNMEVIKSADWVIDLGPEGGTAGGHLVCCGTPETVAECAESYTGQFLKEKLGVK